MQFKDIFREERHFCNHLFRLLCYRKEDGGEESGLGRFLSLTGLPLNINVNTITDAEVYTEVAVFRDYYHHLQSESRNKFLIDLYEAFLPSIKCQYRERIDSPTPIADELKRLRGIHPNEFSQHLTDTEDNRLFYREFSALFNAKPDFLLICDGHMIWIEVKFWEAFDLKQLQRTKNIAELCSLELFKPLFYKQKGHVFKLGTQRHVHSRNCSNFIDWACVSEIAKDLLPHHTDNYTARALKQLVDMDIKKGRSGGNEETAG